MIFVLSDSDQDSHLNRKLDHFSHPNDLIPQSFASDNYFLFLFKDQLDKFVEEQLQQNSAAGSGALEHDHCWLYRPEPDSTRLPLPLGVALIDQSVLVFGKVFPRAAQKHRLQMLLHFNDCLKTAKSARVEALQMNIFAALLAGFKVGGWPRSYRFLRTFSPHCSSASR